MRSKLTTAEFVSKAQNVHNDRYNYNLVEYVTNAIKVLIYCNECRDVFTQAPNYHLLGQGCPACGRKRCDKNRCLTTEDFVQRSNIKHKNFYDYTNTVYVNNKTPVNICCPIHGDFQQVSYNHIRGSGCQRCSKMGFSIAALSWIEKLEHQIGHTIQTIKSGSEYVIPGTRYKADGYCVKTNTIYEYYGDKWHGNPKVYSSDEKCHPYSDKTAGELFKQTMNREATIIKLGFNVVTKWETT